MQGYGTNFRAPRVNVHDFAMVPRADIPRSRFNMPFQHKTTISASNLYPVYLQEILPGDAFNVSMSAYCRLATPLFPMMDNMELESFFFFVPCRLLWIHWYKFMGEQDQPTDSISFNIPQIASPAAGFAPLSIFDYFGLPIANALWSGNATSVSALPLRAYNLIWNQWFRDENLNVSLPWGSTSGLGYVNADDGPDPIGNYGIQPVARRHDYFTSCLPWTQKGGVAVTLPLQGQATVKTASSNIFTGAQNQLNWLQTSGSAPVAVTLGTQNSTGQTLGGTTPAIGGTIETLYPSNLYADLSTATATTINALRLAFQTQKLLERDARGGTRYTEIIRAHFGVLSPDARLQRPEYLGGSVSPITISPVPQTSGTSASGTTTPMGTLAAVGTTVHRSGYRQSFTEHGYVLGLVTVRANQVYQQGMRRLWSRLTRYDFAFPVFSALGEQAVLNKEIFCDGSANDALTFGFQERYGEYRFHPSYTSGYFRSQNATPLDAWHLGNKFAALPVLNASFIADGVGTTLTRNLALGAAANNQQFLCDFYFAQTAARPLPMFGVPGRIDQL